jgi:hypothetical protein
MEVTGVYFNEMKNIPWHALSMAMTSINRYPAKIVDDAGRVVFESVVGHVIFDTNPGDADQQMYRYFDQVSVDRGERGVGDNWLYRGRELFVQPGGRTPEAENTENLTGGKWYYHNLAGEISDQAYIDVFIDGKRRFYLDGRPVFKETFRRSVHVSNEELVPIAKGDVYIGMDFGRTPACTISQVVNGQIRTIDEVVSFDMGIEQFERLGLAPLLMRKYPECKVMIIGDPAGVQKNQSDERSCFSVLKDKGYDVRPAWSNTYADRWGAAEQVLTQMVRGEPMILISPACKMLVKGLEYGYYLRRLNVAVSDTEVRHKEVPEKNDFSHIVEAWNYGVMPFTNKQQAGDRPYQNIRAPQATRGGY